MFDKLSILMHDNCTKYTFEEWEEVPNLLEVTYYEGDSETKYILTFALPVFSKEDWEEFKHAGDIAFSMMEKTHV